MNPNSLLVTFMGSKLYYGCIWGDVDKIIEKKRMEGQKLHQNGLWNIYVVYIQFKYTYRKHVWIAYFMSEDYFSSN